MFLCVTALAGSPESLRPTPLKGGIEFQGADVKKLQADDFANPAMLWVTKGEAQWKSCTSCHGDAKKSMKGVAARYPRYDEKLGRVVTIEQRINACVTDKQKRPALAHESDELLSLTAFIAYQARGMPITVSIDGPAKPVFEAGEKLYHTRIGQLHLACTNCHDHAWGKTLLAESVSQGHPDGWPAYRLEWQALGSLQRRLRACFFGVRAEMPAYGSDDFTALELYLGWRAQGLPQSAPGVRR